MKFIGEKKDRHSDCLKVLSIKELLKFKLMDLKQTYNKIALDWTKDHAKSDWWAEPAHIFLQYLKPKDKILDVGCASGLKTKYLIEKGFKVTGIDFSEEMIKLAKEHCPEAEFYVRDIKEPLNLEIFDAIFAQAVLLHIPKVEFLKVLENLNNNLKSGGYIYLAVKELKEGEQEEQTVIENDYNYEYERFFSFFTMPEIKNYLAKLDIKILHDTIIPRGQTNWIVVIAQKSNS